MGLELFLGCNLGDGSAKAQEHGITETYRDYPFRSSLFGLVLLYHIRTLVPEYQITRYPVARTCPLGSLALGASFGDLVALRFPFSAGVTSSRRLPTIDHTGRRISSNGRGTFGSGLDSFPCCAVQD